MRIADEFDPSVIKFDNKTALMQFDVNLTPAKKDERERRHHWALQNKDIGCFELLVKDDVRRVKETVGAQNRRRMNLHLDVINWLIKNKEHSQDKNKIYHFTIPRSKIEFGRMRDGQYGPASAFVVSPVRSHNPHQLRIKWRAQDG